MTDLPPMLQRHTARITLNANGNGLPDGFAYAKLGNVQCCYLPVQTPNGTRTNVEIEGEFELCQLRLKKGFKRVSYTVKPNGDVEFTLGDELPNDLKLHLLYEVEEGNRTKQHQHFPHGPSLAGTNGCPKPGTGGKRFLIFSPPNDAGDKFYFMFIYPTQEIIYHIMSKDELLACLPDWHHKLQQPKDWMLQLDAIIHYDDDLEIFYTEGQANKLVFPQP